MAMEASPFDRQNQPLSIILVGPRAFKVTSAEPGRGDMSGAKVGRTACSERPLLRDLNVGARQWDAFTRLETRTKESNRHARGKILLTVLLSY